MLVARRDPPLHSEAYDGAHGHRPPQISRFIHGLQVIGSLLAIPVGLASAYSVYHTNFTVEARCASLRANIVSMLDKSADAATLRMLVRRDAATFEQTCGAVDPDAVKAFKALLTGKAAAPAQQQAAREPVRQPAETAKQNEASKPTPVAAEAKPVEAKPGRRDAETTDAKWIVSVREALTHAPAAQEETMAAPVATPAPPAMQPPLQQTPQPRVVHEAPAAPPMPLAAPVLPAPVAIAPAPAPAADHPVPPGSIPYIQPAAKPAETTPGHSWIAKIPLLNRVVGE
jgi:hypothetical protein